MTRDEAFEVWKQSLDSLVSKWEDQISLHRRVCEDPLMYTKEDRLKNSHYCQAICAVVSDIKQQIEKINKSAELPTELSEGIIALGIPDDTPFDYKPGND